MNFENTFLFTSCVNGIVGIFSVIHDKSKSKDFLMSNVITSEEILIEKEQRDKLKREIISKRFELETDKINFEAQTQMISGE